MLLPGFPAMILPSAAVCGPEDHPESLSKRDVADAIIVPAMIRCEN